METSRETLQEDPRSSKEISRETSRVTLQEDPPRRP